MLREKCEEFRFYAQAKGQRERLFEAAHEKRYLMAFSVKFEIFRYSCSQGFQKYATENRFEISLFITELRLFL